MAAVETASAEERERLRAAYKQRLHDMDARLKVACRVSVPAACICTSHSWVQSIMRPLWLIQLTSTFVTALHGTGCNGSCIRCG